MQKKKLKLNSPAKVNLFLRVLRKRADGYHELASLFQAITLMDQMTFEEAENDALSCSDPQIPCDERNLVIKALHLFRQQTGQHLSLQIHIEKKIPIEAGLGGGSSNAATTLWALNQLTNQPLSQEQLIDLAGRIGADVPFFLSQGTAYCTGYGNHVTPVTPLPNQSLCIVKPPFGLSTPQVYKTLNLQALTPRNPQETLDGFINNHPTYYNDLEQPAFALCQQTTALRQKLLNCGFETVLLSGSGSSFFCIGPGTVPQDPKLKTYQVAFAYRDEEDWFQAS